MNRKRKRLYRTIGFAILIFAVGFIVNDQLRKVGNRISGDYLQELIAKESQGLYRINFDDIELNLFKKSITINNLELTATPENRQDSINAKNIYEAQVAQVYISLESVIRIYTDKELVVDGIEVIDPKLFMTKINPEKKPLKFGRETGQLYDVISQYLDLLQINFLKVRSGSVNHSPSNFKLKAIDFSVEEFTVSQQRKKKKIFYSEAINLGVNQQSILLPDSIHELSFEGFELSTKDSILNFNDLKITVRKDIDGAEVFEKQNQNVYDIDVPTLELKGINYLKAYEDNFLVVEQVNIPKPKIKIQSVLKSRKLNTEQAENSIGASLLALFDLIKINDFRIHEGGLNLTLKGDNQQRFLSDNISIDLFNIELDSTQRDIQNIIHYFENASVEINDYDYLLPDNLHNIKFKKLNFNTLDSTLLVKNLEIRPSRTLKDSTLTQFTLNLPILEMRGIAHRNIYDNDRIDLQDLTLRNAKIEITPPYFKNSDKQQAIITPEELYKILGKNFTEIKLKKFAVLNSDLQVADIFKGKSLNIQAHFLQIDSTLQSWHKISDSTLINGQELVYNMTNGKVRISTFQSQNNLHSLDLNNLNLDFQGLRDQIKIDYLSLRGVELDSIINKKKLNIDSLTLLKPQLKLSYKDLKKQSNKGNAWIFPQKPINILLQEGALKYQIDKYRSLNIADFDIDLNYQNEVRLFQILAKDLRFEDEQLKHRISVTKLVLPKNQNQLSLQQLNIQPIQRNDSLSLDVKIPEIKFSNFNKDALFQNNSFEADNMLINIEQLNYIGTTALNKYFESKNENASKFKFAVGNANVNVVRSSVSLLNAENKNSKFQSFNSKLEFQNLNFPKKANSDLVYAEDFTINNETFTLYTANSDTIAVKNLSYRSYDKAGEIRSFRFMGSDSATSLEIQNLKLQNAYLGEYLRKNRVVIQEISSTKTNFNFKIENQDKSSIAESIELPFKQLKIEQLNSNNINIKIFHKERKRNFYVRQADLSINALKVDSTLNPKEIHHHIESLIFTGKDYRENFGKHYTVYADEYTFSYPASNFQAHNIKMRSKYDRFEYSDHIQSQNDWFKLDISSLELEQLNIDSLLIAEKFILNKLKVANGDLTVFRDLNVPHNDQRRVPMPQQVLSKSDFAFSVDSVLVNSDIHIHIVPKEASGIGTMTLNIDSGFIFNMRSHHFKSGKPMLLQAKGRLNEAAKFNTKVNFPIPSEKGEFQFLGNISPMELRNLNEMLIPLGAIEVRSGYNEGVNINFKGNEDYAEGLMEFRYNNLKIDILDRETYQSKGFGNNLKTIFANSFVVSNKNPRWFKLQQGNIFYERIESRSIFNLWAKALLSGAVSSIGIKKSKEEAKAYYKENKDQIED
ncbi:hypothetical protein [Marivirga harenae]|uniref:hypothetical protein n=1 Tax=Marivirga harenae TaxID=2010992 RepID=UPI0026DECDC1|nr:hypothetical protein [Marivirga harenae]WKV11077.1 hypothetical protein Q3Y49_12720 [Marivirga harenae]|tara:strand:- start:174133 stop:178224 length:4092 start_codon:yes stop_codon:yes gene_type:complete